MKGSYLLIMEIKEDKKIKIGALGKIEFKKGYYAYVGSAMSSIEKRVERHLRKEKKLRWHIDYLLQHAELKSIFYRESNEKEECSIAKAFSNGFPCIKNFGSSDCKCKGHLFYSKNCGNFYTLAKKLGMKKML